MSTNEPQSVLEHPQNLPNPSSGEFAQVNTAGPSPSVSPNLNTVLLDLRVSVMRAISDVWQADSAAEEKLETNDWQHSALKIISLLKGEAPEKPITITSFNQWLSDYLKKEPIKSVFARLLERKHAAYFRKLIEFADPENLKSIWKLRYHLQSPYPKFGVQIIKPTARWNHYGDNQWTKPDTEELFVSLPANLPKNLIAKEDQAQTVDQLFIDGESIPNITLSKDDRAVTSKDMEYLKASVLMEYYQYFPSFLGRLSNDETPKIEVTNFMTLRKTADFPQMNRTLNLESWRSQQVVTDSKGSNYDLGLASVQFEGFSAMTAKLLSVIWNNEVIRKRLDYALRLFNETTLLDSYAREQAGLDAKATPQTCSFKNLFDFSFFLNTLKGEAANELYKFNKLYTQELNATLKKYFQYETPWVFQLRLIVPDNAVFFQKRVVEGKEVGVTFNPNQGHVLNLTTIEIPYAPGQHDTNNVSLALARYNATGPAYPFTCS